MDLEKAIKLLENEKYEEAIDKIKEAFRSADRVDLGGWKIDVVMDDDGDIWTTGLMSQNSTLQSTVKGNTIVIATVGTYNVLEGFSLTEEIRNHDDYEKIKNEYDGDEDSYGFLEFVEYEYPDILEQLEDEYREYFYDECEDDYAENELDRAIEQLKNDLEMNQLAEKMDRLFFVTKILRGY